jgi:hypothetical protein
MSKAATRGTLIRDHELATISRGLDLLATLHPDRREFVASYWLSRLGDLPVAAQVEEVTEEIEDDSPVVSRLSGAAA